MSDDTQLMTKVQELADRAEILDCLHRYTRGMDRLDRELARSAYHDDAIDIHLTIVATVDAFLDWAFKYHAKQSCHQHYITNHTVELDGDTAHAETYYLFVGSYPNDERPVTVAGGRYIDRLERRDGRWAIAARVCTAEWEHQSRVVPAEPTARPRRPRQRTHHGARPHGRVVRPTAGCSRGSPCMTRVR